MFARSVRPVTSQPSLAVLAACALALLAAQVPADPSEPRATLAYGAGIAGELAGGGARTYLLPPQPATLVESRTLVTLEQRGIDLALELRSPDGTLRLAVDGPTDSEGVESLLVPPGLPAPLELRVASPNPGSAPGSYTLRLDLLSAAAPEGRTRIEGERLFTEAAARNREGAAGSAAAFRQGMALYERALELWRGAGERSQEARAALSAAAISIGLGEAEPALDRAAAALALYRSLGDESGQLMAWGTVGLARTALGRPDEAIAAQTAALELAGRLGRVVEEGKARNNLGYARHAKGDLRPAREDYRQALERFARAGEHGWWEAAVLQNLAAVETALGEPDGALASHRRVLERQRALGDRRGEAQTLNNLGVLQDGLGLDGEARDSYTAALAAVRAFGDRAREGALLYNLGIVDHRLGDLPRALRSFAASLAIRREIGDRAGEGRTEAAIAGAYGKLGAGETARAAAERAVALARAAGDGTGERIALRLRGSLALAAGDPAAALPELTRGLELARGAGDRAEEAAALGELGAARLALGETDAAVTLLRQGLERAREAKNPLRIAALLTRLAQAEHRRGESGPALAEVEEALSLIEAERALEPDPELRATSLAARHEAYELRIELLMERERQSPGQGFAAAAFAASERSRARSLLDLLEAAGTELRSGIEPELFERERSLLLRLRAKERLREGRLRRTAGGAPAPELEAEIRSLLAELSAVEVEIRRASPRYADLTQPPLATAGEIRALLDGETLLLEYALGEERSWLFAVERNGLAAYELPARAEIESAAGELRRRLRRFEGDEAALAAASSRLGRLLLSPVAARLGTRRLVVVPDGALLAIPFSILRAGGREGAPAAGDPPLLLERHEVVYAPSASTVALQRRLARPAPAPRSVAVLADPVFDPRDPRVTAPGPRPAPPAADGEEMPQRLPWTRREAEAIAAVAASVSPPAGALPPPLLALDFQASRETALSPEIARAGILHFATHGRVDTSIPALTGLLLSGVDAAGARRDGFLGLRDLYNLRLGADLVVLSGCDTALGRELRGEGLLGLTQGFLYAGARRVLASLWRVEDRATAELMARFYRGLLVEGRTPAAALRQAQLAVRADRRWRSPSFWAGFVLLGDWGDPAGWPPERSAAGVR